MANPATQPTALPAGGASPCARPARRATPPNTQAAHGGVAGLFPPQTASLPASGGRRGARSHCGWLIPPSPQSTPRQGAQRHRLGSQEINYQSKIHHQRHPAPESPRRPTRQESDAPKYAGLSGRGGGVSLPKQPRSPQAAGVGGRGRIVDGSTTVTSEHPKTRSAATQAWLPGDQPSVKDPPPTPSTRPSPTAPDTPRVEFPPFSGVLTACDGEFHLGGAFVVHG
jgi:hypothetical protein